MRRGGTGLVVLVVAAIALAAGIDALRGGGSETIAESEQPPAPTSTETAPSEKEPAPGLGGTLYFTDASCELQAVELPASTPVDPPNWDECRFVLSPDGRRVSGAGTGWDPHSDPLIGRVFQAEDGLIQVSRNSGPEGEPFVGTAPAWKPDGTLTYFADGAVRVWPSGEVVLSQRTLRRATRAAMPFQGRLQALSLREAAWLDDRQLAAIVSTHVGGEPTDDLLAVYDGNRLATWRRWEHQALSELRVSPQGIYAAARTGSDGLEILDSSGLELETPPIVGYRAIAWSPDDRWAAVASDDGVVVFRPGVPGPPDLELDLDTRDLDWRGELGPDAVSRQGDADAAAEWLARVGVGGRLFVTQRGGDSCRLRALELPSLDWAETPPGLENPCRFTVDFRGVVLREGEVPQPDGGEIGTCDGLDECAFAWAPDGRPTYVSGGELFAGRPGGRSELLVSAAKLREIVGGPSALERVAWLDEDRFWAVVRADGADGIALMSTDSLVYSPWFAAPRIDGLEVSSAGMAAVSSDRGVAIFDGGGRRRLNFTSGRDVTWAPDELIAAVSTRDGLLFVAPVTGEVVPLPLEVEDLEWVTP